MKYIILLSLFLANVSFAEVGLSKIGLSEVNSVKVEKSTSTMYLLNGDIVIKEYHVAFGENPKGHKQQEGNERTPEGRYILDYKKEDSSFYRAWAT